ncbi:MAG: NAD(+) synthase [Sphaerochaetaceae bacterium]|nr:NAD(+) synthase [Sphaerochaetaceae bacterium]
MRHGFIKVAAATPAIRVADCSYNAKKIITLINSAYDEGVHLLVLPELCVTGYTCQDLFQQQALISKAMEKTVEIATQVPRNMVVVFGSPIEFRGKLHNCAIVASAGKILGIVPKINIPNYQEFYEQRWFTPALPNEELIEMGDQKVYMGGKLIFTCKSLPYFRLACEVCEDLWVPNQPSVNHSINGATVIANISASDEFAGKATYRKNLVESQSARLICGYIYADAGEGESSSDLVFTGNDYICENGSTLAHCTMEEDSLLITELDLERLEHERRLRNTYVTTNDKEYRYISFDLEIGETNLTRFIDCHPFVPSDKKHKAQRCEEILTLQALGLKRRLSHTRTKTAVIGLSGGLDSTLALLVTVKAFDMLGWNHNRIEAITMPCFGTTTRTKSNAVLMAERLGCNLHTIDISKSVMQHFEDIGQDPNNYDVTYENSQARERTQVLMDMANKTGGLVVGTGDLSELALGWATYNGDHMSMYGVNAGVPKTLVRYLVQHYADTSSDEVLVKVLDSVLETPISPELIPGAQITEDLVGPYDLHDFFIYNVLRWGYSPSKVYRLALKAFDGLFDEETILKWLRIFYRRFFNQQFKRSCLPDGPKVGSVALSPRGDLRMPSDACVQVWQEELENSLY